MEMALEEASRSLEKGEDLFLFHGTCSEIAGFEAERYKVAASMLK
jgi:hypothetical protein